MVITTQKSERKSFILSIRERIRWDVERLTKIDRKLNANGLIYTADDVIDEFNRYAHTNTLCSTLWRASLPSSNRTAKSGLQKHTSPLSIVSKKYREDEDIMLDCLTSEIMEAYEAWYHKRALRPTPYLSIPEYFVRSITVRSRMTSLRIATRSEKSILG